MLCKKIASQDAIDRLNQGLDRLLEHINNLDVLIFGKPYTADISLRKIFEPQIKAAAQAQQVEKEKQARTERWQSFEHKIYESLNPKQQVLICSGQALHDFYRSEQRIFWEKTFTEKHLWEQSSNKILIDPLCRFLETYGMELPQLNSLIGECQKLQISMRTLLSVLDDYIVHIGDCHDITPEVLGLMDFTDFIDNNEQEIEDIEIAAEVEDLMDFEFLNDFATLEEVNDPNFPYFPK